MLFSIISFKCNTIIITALLVETLKIKANDNALILSTKIIEQKTWLNSFHYSQIKGLKYKTFVKYKKDGSYTLSLYQSYSIILFVSLYIRLSALKLYILTLI